MKLINQLRGVGWGVSVSARYPVQSVEILEIGVDRIDLGSGIRLALGSAKKIK